MYEVRVEDDSVQVRNGSGSWTTPVVHGRKLYPSHAALAKAHDTKGYQVTNAINNGSKFRGREVRKATEEEVRAKLKIKEDDSFAYRVNKGGGVEIRTHNGQWGKAVFYNGYFYDSQRQLCDREKISKTTVSGKLRRGGDDKLRYATIEDLPEGGIEVHRAVSNKKRDAAIKRENGKKKKVDKPFEGVKWADGSVEIRLKSGGFSMTRSSAADVPSEIAVACEWLTQS